MSKSNDDKPVTAKKFMKEFHRYQKGSITRRHFLGVTGLGTAMAVMGAAVPSLWSGKPMHSVIWATGWYFPPGPTIKIRSTWMNFQR